MWRAIVSYCKSRSSKLLDQRIRHLYKRYTHWHRQHCKSLQSTEHIRAAQVPNIDQEHKISTKKRRVSSSVQKDTEYTERNRLLNRYLQDKEGMGSGHQGSKIPLDKVSIRYHYHNNNHDHNGHQLNKRKQ